MTTDLVIRLDDHRVKPAHQISRVHRLLVGLITSRLTMRQSRGELEAELMAAPALSWSEAADKARYLLQVFAATPMAQASYRQKLIASVLEDFARLSRADGAYGLDSNHHQGRKREEVCDGKS
ncbi:MAG: hypothetical protein AB7O44_32955 [Hyphomicrobiaceae bacterium]